LGTAFLDRGRCLPWAMDKPCIVCQENCPVSPKAIYTGEVFNTVRNGKLTVEKAGDKIIETVETIAAGKFATGDYYCTIKGDNRHLITANGENTIEVSEKFAGKPAKNSIIEIQVRLQRPFVDIEKCIGCGICQR